MQTQIAPRRFSLFAIVGLCGLLLAGCGGGHSGSIVGTWDREGGAPGGYSFGDSISRVAFDDKGVLTRTDVSGKTASTSTSAYQDLGNGNLRITQSGSAVDFTYEIDGDKLLLKPPSAVGTSGAALVFDRAK